MISSEFKILDCGSPKFEKKHCFTEVRCAYITSLMYKITLHWLSLYYFYLCENFKTIFFMCLAKTLDNEKHFRPDRSFINLKKINFKICYVFLHCL